MTRLATYLLLGFLTLSFSLLPVVIEDNASAWAASGKKSKKNKSDGDDLEYMRLKPLFFPVVNRQGATQQVSMVISVEVDDGKKDDLEVYRPRLMNAYIQELYGSLGSGEAMIHGNVVDIEKIRERLVSLTQNMVGEEFVIHDVLFEVVSQRPL